MGRFKNKIMLEKTKTPYYIIHKDILKDNLLKLRSALEATWNNYIIGYSYKTNALPWILEFFKNNGCYAEVVSDDEYYLAKAIGIENDQYIYNGIAKSKDTFLDAIRNHAIVNIDAEYEIEWLEELERGNYSIGIRANFDLESKCPGQTQCGKDGERFGFCYENGELKKAIERIKETGIRIDGLHLHKSSKTRMPDVYCAIAEAAVKICQEYSLNLSYIDIGGGFFGGLESKPQFIEYFDLVSRILRQQFNPLETKLIVEPGMALIGSAIDYVTSVLDVKRTIRNKFVVTDGSRTQIDPLMTKSTYFYEINRKNEDREINERQVVTGYTCMEHDRLFEITNDKELLPGDRIIYHKVGAYTICLSPLFIKWFPDVYVKEENKVHKIREKWTTNDFIRRSISL